MQHKLLLSSADGSSYFPRANTLIHAQSLTFSPELHPPKPYLHIFVSAPQMIHSANLAAEETIKSNIFNVPSCVLLLQCERKMFFFFLLVSAFELTCWVLILRTARGPGPSATSRLSLLLSPCSSRCHCDTEPPQHPHALLLPPSDPLRPPH